jgi:hypothetical protein
MSHDINIEANIKSGDVYPEPYYEMLHYIAEHFGDFEVPMKDGRKLKISEVFTDIEIWT